MLDRKKLVILVVHDHFQMVHDHSQMVYNLFQVVMNHFLELVVPLLVVMVPLFSGAGPPKIGHFGSCIILFTYPYDSEPLLGCATLLKSHCSGFYISSLLNISQPLFSGAVPLFIKCAVVFFFRVNMTYCYGK